MSCYLYTTSKEWERLSGIPIEVTNGTEIKIKNTNYQLAHLQWLQVVPDTLWVITSFVSI